MTVHLRGDGTQTGLHSLKYGGSEFEGTLLLQRHWVQGDSILDVAEWCQFGERGRGPNLWLFGFPS